jgi:two-component system alkaline phosphatase synthesis response regulator PhoP
MKRILVVDDDVAFTRLLKLNLERTGNYSVRVENWAEDALPVAREFRPDLVLLDILMPRQFGGNVAASFRADAELKQTPIVFLTATVQKATVDLHGGTISGYPFLAKPASLEEVIVCIEQHLQPR